MVALIFDATQFPQAAPIAITVASSHTAFAWNDRRGVEWHDLCRLLTHAEIGQKNGSCYTPAVFSGRSRRQDQAVEIGIAVLDSDCGHTLAEIESAIAARGWRAIVHSTYSHLTDTTTIAASAYDKWHAENPTLPVSAYMVAKKSYLPRVVENAQIIEQADGGASYRVLHNPCPKFRIVIPLDQPWLACNFESQAVANATWAERIGALASALGLQHDQSCTDTSRLFYFPRIRENTEFVSRVIEGDTCPLWELPEATAPAPTLFTAQTPTSGPRLLDQSHKIFQSADGAWLDLTAWAAEYAARFEIVTALKSKRSGIFGSRRSGVKHHLTCPNAESHTSGALDQTGTYAVNASDLPKAALPSISSGFVIHCMHNGCAGLDRLDHLHHLLRSGALSIPDLSNPDFLTPPHPEVDISALVGPKQPEFEGNIPPRLYSNLPGVMGDMHKFINETSAKPQPALNLGAVLAFMSAVIGRKVQLQGWGIRPNIYVLSIGYSGAGKERPLSAIKEMARAACVFEKLIGVEEVASDAGIINCVHKQPSQVMLLDEMSFLLSATNSRQAGPHMINVTSTLLKLYSSSHTIFKGKSYANEPPKIIDQPSVSLYGCSTPNGLFSALSSKDITGGLLSRIVLFDAGEHDPLGKAPANLPVPSSVIEWLRAWDNYQPAVAVFPFDAMAPTGGKPTSVMMTAEAMDVAHAFEAEMHAEKIKARSRGMDALYVRARENALKFALIRACAAQPVKTDTGWSVDEAALKVDAETMKWACALSRAAIAGMNKGAIDQISDSPFETKVRNLSALIQKSGEKGITNREMKRASAGRLPKKELEDVLSILCESRSVYYVSNINSGKRGVKREAYVHRDFVKIEGGEDGE